MNILDFKPASKFILTKDFVKSHSDYRGTRTITYPKNLVISVSNVSFKVTGIVMTFKIIRAKQIIKKYYQDISKKVYLKESWRWGDKDKEFDMLGYNYFHLENEELERFLNEKPFISFTKTYNQLTK